MTSLRFSDVVGQHDAKRALVLAAIRPSLGGVLLRGDKGSAKTTLARGLAALLPGDAPFVEVPLGAGEDRVIGSLDLASVLAAGEATFRPGLLAAAHGGVLYIDEVNLLADHLVDALLDVAATGWNHVERDGVSHRHPARFVMVASMNPEEGELRPQLLDRFGLSVEVSAPTDVDERVEAVRRQLHAEAAGDSQEAAHETVDHSGEAADRDLREQIATARAAAPTIGTDVMDAASRLALAVGAEGLRADLMLCRAAAALAAVESRPVVTPDDVRSVAAMVLGHRRRRTPFEQPGIDDTELDRAWHQSHREPPPPTGSESYDGGTGPATASEPAADEPFGDEATAPPDGGGPDRVDLPGTASAQFDLGRPRTRSPRGAPAGRSGSAAGTRGRSVRSAPLDAPGASGLDTLATATAYASRTTTLTPRPSALAPEDLRSTERLSPTGELVVLVVDASSSMGVEHRMATTKATVMSLLAEAYRRRGRVAVITFRGDSAQVVLRPTASIEIARARLADLATGGATPLAAGLDSAVDVVTGSTGDRSLTATVVVVTDGRATAGGSDPVAESVAALERLARTGARVILLDTEREQGALRLAEKLASAAGVEYRRLSETDQAGRPLVGWNP